MKVLIVEDDTILAKMYKQKFELSGFEVLEAANGEDALIIALTRHPDAILLDIMLPKLDGLSMMDKLRLDDWGKKAPIVILTNLDANDDIIQKVIVDQPSYYMLKSNSTPEEVVGKVMSVVH